MEVQGMAKKWAVEWFRYYIVFSKGACFIFGVILSQGLVEYAVTAVLMSYLTDIWKSEHLNKAAAVINVKEGVSTVMVIVAAHISDAYVGRFLMVLFTTAAYIIGLVLLWVGEVNLSHRTKVELFYLAMLLIALGIAGRDASLKAFLADQLRKQEPADSNIDEERVEARRKVWWRFAWFSGAAISAFAVPDDWGHRFRMSAIAMGVAFLLLLSGTTFYYRKKPTGSPLTIVYRVFKAAILKKHLDYPIRPEQFFNNDGKQIRLLPHIPFFRWLDKAAIVETSSVSQLEEEEKKGKICRVARVSKVKVVLKMGPMWTTFLVYSLVEATGSTFFIEQTSNLNDKISIGNIIFTVSIALFLVIKSFSSFTISYMHDLLVPKLWGGANLQRTRLVRIGSGMVCSILCCISAWQVEVHRLHLVAIEDLADDNSENTISMSILWLAPQFCLLGLMEGLAEEGLEEFFKHHVDESTRSYGPPCIMGIGKFLSIPCVLVFRGWFKDTLNNSHLDRYYIMLAVLSVGNLCFYWYVSKLYAFKDATVEEEVELDQLVLLEEGFTSLATKVVVPVATRCHRRYRSWSWNAGILSSCNPCSPYKLAKVVPIRSKTFS